MGSADDGGLPVAARRAAAHVFVDDLDAPVLGPDDLHHLRRVLRLRAGEVVSVADGRGGWRPCRLDGDSLVPDGEALVVPAPAPAVTVAVAVPKGDRAEWAVQKLTEVGVDRIVPLVTERGVVRWDPDRAARQRSRWEAIARQAAMQSRRARVPVVGVPVTVVELAGGDPGGQAVAGGAGAGGVGGSVAMAEPDGSPPDVGHPTLLIGPEGGWSDAELALGLPAVTLGATVLRTETAAVLAGALLVALRSGIVGPR